jgi:AcrR family transcriptional regulator
MRVKTDEKRDEILAVAAEVFREQGYERASMAAISTRLGGSKSTLYGYFESKADLFVAVMLDAGSREMGDAIADLTLARGDLRSTLLHFSERYVDFVVSERAITLHRTVIGESSQSDIGQRFFEAGPRQAYERVEAFLAEAMAAGLLRRASTERAAHHFLGLVNAETLMPALYGVPLTRKQTRTMVRDAVDVFLAAYAVPAGG